ncbi:hypothetical protein B0I33_10219 [Prauserella shujinwangii]|uniref:Secreted protein n=1 Tax=Prauserella shujinwangii TaxID=1453103 RepID=A0A2T0LZX7_9PSEU|nr:hypothetical protein [Prauserella shujinwangii]PRX49906.1 hypothetical protein B0I33_10219 [Prauserella shujinwangii]
MARAKTSSAARPAGVVPLVAGVASALALTGAAVFTVEQATCTDPGQYVRHDNHVELIGGCFDGADLPETTTGNRSPEQNGAAVRHNLRP